jgi:hypothetical protein
MLNLMTSSISFVIFNSLCALNNVSILTEGLATQSAFCSSVIAGLNCARGKVIYIYVLFFIVLCNERLCGGPIPRARSLKMLKVFTNSELFLSENDTAAKL